MNEDQVRQLLATLQSEIETWDQKRNSDFVDKQKKAVAHGRYVEAKFILDQLKAFKKKDN